MLRASSFTAVLLFGLLSLTAGQIIYMDYTSGFSTPLPGGIENIQVDSQTYNTITPGSYSFGVTWNGDLQDEFTLDVPVNVMVTPLNNAQFCTPNQTTSPPNQVTFTAFTPRQCNYTASWQSPFIGVLSVEYQADPNSADESSDDISTFFTFTSVVGDPQFMGLRGQSFQVHGIDGAVYNIISEKNTQVNSRFVFLTEGKCPVIDGVPATSNCWSHPGSYLGEMSFQQVVNGKLHAALLVAGPASVGFSTVQMDGRPLKVGQRMAFGGFAVAMDSAYNVRVSMENFEFELDNSDRFINQALRSKVALAKLQSHGLLGQTHSSKTHPSSLKYIEGEPDDYLIEHADVSRSRTHPALQHPQPRPSSTHTPLTPPVCRCLLCPPQLFGTDFMYNRFEVPEKQAS